MKIFKKGWESEKYSFLHLSLGIVLLVCFYQELFSWQGGSGDGWRKVSWCGLVLSIYPAVASLSFYTERKLSYKIRKKNALRILWSLVLLVALWMVIAKVRGIFLYRPLGNFLLSPKEDLHYLDVLDHYEDVFRIYTMTGLFTAAFDFSPLRDQDLEEDIEKEKSRPS